MATWLVYVAFFSAGCICHRAWQNDESLNNLCDCVLYLLLAAKEYACKKFQQLMKAISPAPTVNVAKNKEPNV
jgi:hypothetical protein